MIGTYIVLRNVNEKDPQHVSMCVFYIIYNIYNIILYTLHTHT